MRFPDIGLDSRLVLDDPIRKIHGDPFISQEIGSLVLGVGF